MAFPATPNPGDRHTEGGLIYEFRTPPPRWDLIGPAPAAAEGRFENNYSGDVWAVGHNLNQRLVSVQVVDDSGTVCIPSVDYTSVNVVTLTFSEPVTGTVVVRR